jgi:hypothetical protein
MLATFSLHSVVNSIGGYAGLAALVGLALLVLLYFAQAREVRRLSNWVEAEGERRRALQGAGPRPATIVPGTPPPTPAGVPRPATIVPGTPPPAPAGSTVTTAVPGVRRVAVPVAPVAAAAASAAAGAAVASTSAAPAAPPPAAAAETVTAPAATAATVMAPATAAAIAAANSGEDHAPDDTGTKTEVVLPPGGDPAADGGEGAVEGGEPALADGGQGAGEGGEPALADGGQGAAEGGQPALADGGQGAVEGDASAMADGGQGAVEGGEPALADGEWAADGGAPAHADGGEGAVEGGASALANGGQGAVEGGEPAQADGGGQGAAGGDDEPRAGGDEEASGGDDEPRADGEEDAADGEQRRADGEQPAPDGREQPAGDGARTPGDERTGADGAQSAWAVDRGEDRGGPDGPPTDAFTLAEAEAAAGAGEGRAPEISDTRGVEISDGERDGARISPPVGISTADGAVIAAAAVPLAARRAPIAEPQQTAPGAETFAPSPSPFDLLHADPPASAGAEAGLVEAAAAAPLAPSTAAGSRGRYPPPPQEPPALQAATIRAPSRAAPGIARTEPVRRGEPDGDDGDRRPPRSRGSTLRLLAAAVVIVAVLIFIATRLFGSSSPNTPSTHSTGTSAQNSNRAGSSGPAPATVTVAVLNGTNTSHLASDAWKRLASHGFRQGAIANAPSSDANSSVGYTRGHRKAALEVARDLSLGAGAVAPVHAANLAVAEHSGRAPQVVATLGADYASR